MKHLYELKLDVIHKSYIINFINRINFYDNYFLVLLIFMI